jgi:BarA-like signal transduction histidine kinase
MPYDIRTIAWLKNLALIEKNSKAADILAYILELEYRVKTLEEVTPCK